jgi:alkylation response protein AidB-like acyl-CoA dehydrogenase
MDATDLVGETPASALEQVRALRRLIEDSARAHESATQLGDELLEALHASDILGLMAPRALGGGEADPQTLIEVIRELSYYDGSTGWYCGAVMTAAAVAGAFLGERAVEQIFAKGKPRCAGQAAPLGKARREGDGYRVFGKFSFGSGSPSAEWLVGGYVLHGDDGEPVLGEAGQPRMLIAMVPRAKVEFLGNWSVLGLRGTGSYDFKVLDQVIHEDFAFFPDTPVARRGGALYRMGFMAIPCLTHASFAVGCTRRALDEWAEFLRTKPRPPRGFANQLHTQQHALATAEGELRGAEAYVRRTFEALFDAAEQGEVPPALKVDGRLCASHALRAGAHAAQAAFTACSTAALRDGNRLQRAYRDMQAGNAHFMTGEQSLLDIGGVLAGTPGAFLAF